MQVLLNPSKMYHTDIVYGKLMTFYLFFVLLAITFNAKHNIYCIIRPEHYLHIC